MEVGTLITLLREHREDADELAEVVVGAARDSTGKSLAAAFGVALGVGVLSKALAEQLYDALTSMSAARDLESRCFSDHPAIIELQREVAELTERHERLRHEQANVAARREAVSNLEAKVAAARHKVSVLEAELEALRESVKRLDALCNEGGG